MIIDSTYFTGKETYIPNAVAQPSIGSNNLNLSSLLDNEIEDKESELIDRLIYFIQNNDNKVALQVYSMYNLVKFVKKYPELKIELVALIQIYNNERSAAYKGAVRNFLKRVKKF